jgi:plasmid stabilization system protein ParE
MSLPLTIKPEAENDLVEAFAWYQDRRNGLGVEFLLAYEAALGAIRRNPGAFPDVHRGIHRAILRRFPYAVYYLIGEQLTVIAVTHAKRHPRRWQQRG